MVCAIDIYVTEVLSCFEFEVLRVQPHCFALYQSKARKYFCDIDVNSTNHTKSANGLKYIYLYDVMNMSRIYIYIYMPDTFMASETWLKWSGTSKHCCSGTSNIDLQQTIV